MDKLDEHSIKMIEVRNKDREIILKKYPDSLFIPFKISDSQPLNDCIGLLIPMSEAWNKELMEGDAEVCNAYISFLMWFNNRRMHEEQKDMSEKLELSREGINRKIKKWKVLFEFIEGKVLTHALQTGVFRFLTAGNNPNFEQNIDIERDNKEELDESE